MAGWHTAWTRIINFEELSRQMKAPIEITDDMVVIDIRPTFDYTMAHIPNSINLQWEEFAQVRGPVPGLLQTDVARMARRLALKGVGPSSRVLIVGKGVDGSGDEGRMAWTLFYLGVAKVQLADIRNFDKLLTNIEGVPLKNADRWNPELVESVIATKTEVLDAALSKKSDGAPKTFLLDVRTKAEYFKKDTDGFGYQSPDLQAIHIDWREFFTKSGQVDETMRNRLRAVGIGLNDRVIVMSSRGVRSAAVTMALLTLGFQRAANYAGGYTELLSRRR